MSDSLDEDRAGACPGQEPHRRGGDAKTIFVQETKTEAQQQWDIVADALREKRPTLGVLMDSSRDDVLACMSFRREHWPQIARTNPLEPVNREIERCSDVIGFGHSFGPVAVMPSRPNDEAIVRLVGAFAIVLEPMAHRWLTAGDQRRVGRRAPTRRMMAASSGKIPTTSERRLISLLTRSRGLVELICAQCSLGKSM
jgi:hypothetical protein